MEGVRVLAEEVINLTPMWCFLSGLCLFAFGVCVWLFIICCMDNMGVIVSTMVLFITLVVGFLGGACIYEATLPPVKQYKCVIDDSVPLSDFLEKYDIIDADGEIYIVKEK